MMTREERKRIRKKSRRWNFWVAISSLFRFRRDGSSKMGEAVSPDLAKATPEEALDKLAHEGVKPELTYRTGDHETIRHSMEILKYFAVRCDNYEESDEMEKRLTGFIEEFFENNLRADVSDKDKESHIQRFLDCDGREVVLQHSVRFYKTRSKPKQRKQYIYALYDLVYMLGINTGLKRDLIDVGHWLDISSFEMRQAVFEAMKKHDIEDKD